MAGEVLKINIGLPRKMPWNKEGKVSAIAKQSVEEAYLEKSGFAGDGIGDLKHHGGLDRAVCLYSYEHYQKWEEEFNVSLPMPAFGENVTVSGLMEKDLFIGDRYSLGEAIIEVTQGRVPCSTISKHNSLKPLLSRMFDSCLTGCFFRVIRTGKVEAGQKLQLLERVQDQFSVYDSTRLLFHQYDRHEEIEKLIRLETLADEWKKSLEKKLRIIQK